MALLEPLQQQWRVIKSNRFPCLLKEAELVPLCGVSVGVCPGSGQRGSLGGLPTPLLVLYAGGMRSTLVLLLAFRSGSWTFGLFVRYCP